MKANNTCKQRLNIFYTYNIIARIFYTSYTVGRKFSIHRIKMDFSDKIRLFFNSKHFNEHLFFSRRVKLFPEKVILFEWFEAFDRQCLYMYYMYAQWGKNSVLFLYVSTMSILLCPFCQTLQLIRWVDVFWNIMHPFSSGEWPSTM